MTAPRQLFRRMSLRYLLEQPGRTLLTLLGLTAGITLLFATQAINSTLRYSIDASAQSLAGAAPLEVSATGPSGLPGSAGAVAAGSAGVAEAVPAVRFVSQVSASGAVARALLVGTSPGIAALHPSGLGSLPDELEGPSGPHVWLSERLALDLGVSRGESIRIGTQDGFRRLRVAGVLAGMPFAELNNGMFAITALRTGQALSGKRGRVDSLYVLAEPGASMANVAEQLTHRLRGSAMIGSPTSRVEASRRTFDSIAQLSFLTSAAALFVALLVVLNTMAIALLERRRAVALAFALGARRRDVLRAFLGEAILLGAIGSALGIALGYVLGNALVGAVVNDYPLLPFTAEGALHPSSIDFVLAGAAGPVVAAIGASMPLLQVVRVAPVESLRPAPSTTYERVGGGSRGFGISASVPAALSLVTLGIAAVPLYSLLVHEPVVGAGSMILVLAGMMMLLPRALPVAARAIQVVLERRFAAAGRLAADGLGKQPGRMSVTVGALAITAGLVVGLATQISSFQNQVQRSASLWFGQETYVRSDSFRAVTSDLPLPGRLEAELTGLPGVRAAYPLRFSLVNWSGHQLVVNAVPVARAASEGLSGPLATIPGVAERELVRGLADGGVVVSRYTANRHDLDIGGQVSLPTPRGDKHFPVAAIFDDLLSFDSMYMEYDDYSRHWGDTTADAFAVVAANDPSMARAQLRRYVREQRIPADVLPREQMVAATVETVEGTFSIVRSLQIVALAIAGLIIANTMLTSVLERRWELALSRTLGATPGQVRTRVLLEAVSIGLLGGIAGIALGLAMGRLMLLTIELRYSWELPFEPAWGVAAGAALAAMVVAVLASLYPSHLAARTRVVETLRYE